MVARGGGGRGGAGGDMATTGGTKKGEVGWGNGAVSPTELAHARFHPPGGTQRVGSGLGAPVLFSAETALFGHWGEGGRLEEKTVVFEEMGSWGSAGDALRSRESSWLVRSRS